VTTPAGFLDEDLYPVASAIFGDRLPLAERYAVELATSAVVRGLIGPREVDRIWERHILNCAVIGEVIAEGSTVVDVGSGAGLPGIPLALASPSLTVHLVEPLLRRVQWLAETLEVLALPNVTVERARAEDSELRGRADVVTGRAVAPLARLLPMVAPLLKEPGLVVALKGSAAGVELDEAADVLRQAGVHDARVVECGVDLLLAPTTVVTMSIPTRAAGTSVAKASSAGSATSAGARTSAGSGATGRPTDKHTSGRGVRNGKSPRRRGR
jgi:16S rRNA (guanine527-N7)-methyltransferase